ncbi:Sec-independent protein translocase subunit TatB [Helicobacter magdeburgensis]|uniref:Sec-independent protein translocase protein TatB homolog n=1 Tax=Helicobacter magdeburgensis TaxID=471858 RepID=A0A4U8SYY3_9HELI|nr:Sec-independent protein translocase protein TatB [Helicobacter magdeburgensis]TLD92103.1 Sec-independent protein translocase subunit TatB [Helicobacter magdeburgensis]
MFGIGIFELLVILIVAIIALGPNKLPQTIIDIVKFFRAVRKTMAEAKESFDKEIELSEIKQEALKYRNTISNEVDKLTQDMKLDELRELNINDLSDSLKPLQESLTDTKKELDKEANALHSTLKNLNTELSYESLDSKSEDSKNAESNMPHATAQNLESAESTQDSTLTYKNTTSSKSQDSTPQHIG